MRAFSSSLKVIEPAVLMALALSACSAPKEVTKRPPTDSSSNAGGAAGASGDGTGGDGTGGAVASGGSPIGNGGGIGVGGNALPDSGMEVCAGTKQSTKPKPVDIYIMLDKSGSMQGAGNGGGLRWDPVTKG